MLVRLEAFLRRAGKSGYYRPTEDSPPTVTAPCESQGAATVGEAVNRVMNNYFVHTTTIYLFVECYHLSVVG